MVSVSNPFVDYLNRYTTASPDHEAAFDEFIAQATPPAAGPLRLRTKVESFLRSCFERADPPSVILTGNAGDGKTYLCRQIAALFGGQPFTNWDASGEHTITRDEVKLHIVKDLSELGETQGSAVLRRLASAIGNARGERFLIAANEGRLRYLLQQSPDLAALYTRIDRQLREEPAATDAELVVINLTQVTTSSFVPDALAWITDPQHWEACEPCPIRARCPLHHNATQLRQTAIVQRVQLLYQLLEQLDIHVTVRDMLIHLAYTVSGNQHCARLQALVAAGERCAPYSYYQNIWGRADDNAFRRKASVVGHLGRLSIGDHSLFEIDDFIVGGGQVTDEQAEHQHLFAPQADLDERRFAQARQAYLDSASDSSAAEEERVLGEWLPHCRRKLFFEWHDTKKATRLIPFLFFDLYQRLLDDERGLRDHVLGDFIVGLNRAFSQLYLRDSDYLFVTTQYVHSGEQPRPLVRLRFARTDLWFEPDARPRLTHNFDRRVLYLIVAPPAAARANTSGTPPQPLRWPIGLLQFEYVLRLAQGGTYNVLAEECELDIRSFKDRLLNAFASTPEQSGLLEFFVAERHHYNLRKLWLDEQGNIQGQSS
jgi:hypothetical protein